jgi:hypothetical protein
LRELTGFLWVIVLLLVAIELALLLGRALQHAAGV